VAERSSELKLPSTLSVSLDVPTIHRLFILAIAVVCGFASEFAYGFSSMRCVPECHFVESGVRTGTPEPAFPSKTIRMDAQEVTMRLGKESYTVDAFFRFFNTEETATQWVGFPVRGNVCIRNRLHAPAFIRLNCWMGDRKLALTESGDLIRDTRNLLYTLYYSRSRPAPCDETHYRWLGTYVTFPGRSHATLHLSYEADYIHGGEMPPVAKAIYILGTASRWTGSIGQFTLTVDRSRVKSKCSLRRVPPVILATQDVVRCAVKDFCPFPKEKIEVAISH